MDHSAPEQWGRGRLLAILIGAVLAGVLLLLGLAFSVREALLPNDRQRQRRIDHRPRPRILSPAWGDSA